MNASPACSNGQKESAISCSQAGTTDVTVSVGMRGGRYLLG
ncbi:hypothetical protein ANT2_1404 [plant metagenome]|uniref:Uncharacterized protein n=1 Tax=plant metagenome TaxID=1297885 RepID=A0A484QPU5_9ZZZZ